MTFGACVKTPVLKSDLLVAAVGDIPPAMARRRSSRFTDSSAVDKARLSAWSSSGWKPFSFKYVPCVAVSVFGKSGSKVRK
jgi:hypothetical protein